MVKVVSSLSFICAMHSTIALAFRSSTITFANVHYAKLINQTETIVACEAVLLAVSLTNSNA